MTFFRLIAVIFLLYCSSLAAADIDTAIVQGTADSYSDMLNQLKKHGDKDDDTELQKALLSKLITLASAKPAKLPPAATLKDEAGYRQLFRQYLDWSLAKTATRGMISELTDKAIAVKSQLHNIDAKSHPKQALTLQLQYAFYSKGKRQARDKLSLYERQIEQAQTQFRAAIKLIEFHLYASRKQLKQINLSLAKTTRLIQKEDVELERLKLLDRKEAVNLVNGKILSATKKKQALLKNKLEELFIQFSAVLQAEKGEAAFALEKTISETASTSFLKDAEKDLRELLKSLTTHVLGRAAMIKGAALEEVKDGLSLFWEKANAPLITINDVSISTLKLVLVLTILTIGFIAGGAFKRYVKQASFKNSDPTSSTRTLLANLGNYLIVAITFFIVLNFVGINLSSIAIVAGALSVGIGFGLQNIVSNFISGIILLFEGSIKIGDYLEIDSTLRGRVTDIRMRSTTLSTNDNIDVIVPNQKLIENQVINWTMNDQIRRFRVPFSVAYGTDVQKVLEVVLKAVGNSGFNDIYTSQRRQTSVIMTGMGDSSVDFLLLVWIKGKKSLSPKRTTSRFLILIYNALNDNGIEIPFPQRDLHVRSVHEVPPITATITTGETT